jgi:hypothetical protein
MNSPRRLYVSEKPEVFQDLKDGWWYYNFDIKEEDGWEDEDGNLRDKYSFILIQVNYKPTYKTMVEKAIRLYLTDSEEFDLINSKDESESDAKKYNDWLELRKSIKDKIKQDFEEA